MTHFESALDRIATAAATSTGAALNAMSFERLPLTMELDVRDALKTGDIVALTNRSLIERCADRNRPV